jgi:hypothetical protein
MKRRDFVRAGAGIFVTATLLDDSVSLSAENVVSIRPRLGCGFRSDQLQPAGVERLPLHSNHQSFLLRQVVDREQYEVLAVLHGCGA